MWWQARTGWAIPKEAAEGIVRLRQYNDIFRLLGPRQARARLFQVPPSVRRLESAAGMATQVPRAPPPLMSSRSRGDAIHIHAGRLDNVRNFSSPDLELDCRRRSNRLTEILKNTFLFFNYFDKNSKIIIFTRLAKKETKQPKQLRLLGPFGAPLKHSGLPRPVPARLYDRLLGSWTASVLGPWDPGILGSGCSRALPSWGPGVIRFWPPTLLAH